MAPEQWQGLELSEATDVYALGIIWHELLTGKRPQLGEVATEGISLPSGWESMLEKCLRNKPSERPVLQELEECLSGKKRIGEVGSQKETRTKGRRIMPWAAVLVLGGMVGLGYWMSKGPVNEKNTGGSIEVVEESESEPEVLVSASSTKSETKPEVRKPTGKDFTAKNIVVALDLSGSMLAEDFQLRGLRSNRVNVIKAALKDFVNTHTKDRLGLVVFAGEALVELPLTLEHSLLLQKIDEVEAGSEKIRDGTNINDAMRISTAQFSEYKTEENYLLIISDGNNNIESATETLVAVEESKLFNIKTYTIAIGTNGVAPMPYTDVFDRKRYRNVEVKISDETLRLISKATGSRHFQAESVEQLKEVFDELDQELKKKHNVLLANNKAGKDILGSKPETRPLTLESTEEEQPIRVVRSGEPETEEVSQITTKTTADSVVGAIQDPEAGSESSDNANTPSIEASFDRASTFVGESVTLSVTCSSLSSSSMPFVAFSKPGEDFAALQARLGQAGAEPELPSISGLRFSNAGTSRQFQLDNGRRTSTYTFNFLVLPLKPDNYTLSPIQVRVENQLLYTKPTNLKVLPARKDFQGDDALAQNAFVRLMPAKKTAFVGEVIPVEIQLHYIDGVNVHLPELTAKGFNIAAFPKHKQSRMQKGNQIYQVLTFRTTATPVKAGELLLGPVKLSMVLRVRQKQNRRSPFNDPFDGFFNRYQQVPVNLEAKAQTITVKPLPTVNKPSGSIGAIGKYTMQAQISPLEVTVGEQVTVIIQISGQGSIESIFLPKLNWPGFKGYEPSITTKKEDPLALLGTRTFEQVVVPETDAIVEVPKIEFSFFDPDVGQYKTLSKGPFPLNVKPNKSSTTLVAPSKNQPTVEQKTPSGPDDLFVSAYNLIVQGDNFIGVGQKQSAVQKYREARSNLVELQRRYPNWNTDVVGFRLKYTQQKIEQLNQE